MNDQEYAALMAKRFPLYDAKVLRIQNASCCVCGKPTVVNGTTTLHGRSHSKARWLPEKMK